MNGLHRQDDNSESLCACYKRFTSFLALLKDNLVHLKKQKYLSFLWHKKRCNFFQLDVAEQNFPGPHVRTDN